MTAEELAKKKFEYYELNAPWNKIVGKPEINGSILMYSPAGSGKSTVALQLCHEFTRHGKVSYVAAEEGLSATLKDKIERSGLTKSQMDLHEWKDEAELKDYIQREGVQVLCIDSYTIIDERLRSFEPFRKWCRENKIFLIVIVQQTKDGKFYGNASAGFNVDCKIQVLDGKPSTIATGKNRFGALYEHDVDLTQSPAPFTDSPAKTTAKSKKTAKRTNPAYKKAVYNEDAGNGDEHFYWIVDEYDDKYVIVEHFKIDRYENSNQEEKALISDVELKKEMTVLDEGRKASKNMKSVPRKNPVEVPFSVTLTQLDKFHKIKSIKKLNSYVGHKHPCYIAKHSGEKPNSHISFKYDPDYRNRKYTLDLLLDGQIEYTACSNKSFADSWKEIVQKYGNLVIEIRAQDHAKKVLGAAEYAKQEKIYAKKQKESDCEDKPKPKKQAKSKKAKPKKKAAPKKSAKKADKKKAKVAKKKTSPKAPKSPKPTPKKEKVSDGKIDVAAAKEQQAEIKSLFQMIMEK